MDKVFDGLYISGVFDASNKTLLNANVCYFATLTAYYTHCDGCRSPHPSLSHGTCLPYLAGVQIPHHPSARFADGEHLGAFRWGCEVG